MRDSKSSFSKAVFRTLLLTTTVSGIFIFFNSFLFYNLGSIAVQYTFITLPIFFCLLEKPDYSESYYVAFLAGLWLDLFSPYPFGLFVVSLFTVNHIIKYIIKKYVGIPSFF